MKKNVKIGIICLAGIALIVLAIFLIARLNSNKSEQSSLPTPQTNKPVTTAAQTFCEPNRIYVNLSQCQCPKNTSRFVEIPQGSEEAVLICKTISPCRGENFYEKQAMDLNYQIQKNSVSVSGCLADHPGSGCQEKTLNLSPGQEFYLMSGKEQSVKVSLEKIENKKAHFLFSYGAAPPACETPGGCDYSCGFVKEE